MLTFCERTSFRPIGTASRVTMSAAGRRQVPTPAGSAMTALERKSMAALGSHHAWSERLNTRAARRQLPTSDDADAMAISEEEIREFCYDDRVVKHVTPVAMLGVGAMAAFRSNCYSNTISVYHTY